MRSHFTLALTKTRVPTKEPNNAPRMTGKASPVNAPSSPATREPRNKRVKLEKTESSLLEHSGYERVFCSARTRALGQQPPYGRCCAARLGCDLVVKTNKPYGALCCLRDWALRSRVIRSDARSKEGISMSQHNAREIVELRVVSNFIEVRSKETAPICLSCETPATILPCMMTGCVVT
jgi:hypothetical protein